MSVTRWGMNDVQSVRRQQWFPRKVSSSARYWTFPRTVGGGFRLLQSPTAANLNCYPSRWRILQLSGSHRPHLRDTGKVEPDAGHTGTALLVYVQNLQQPRQTTAWPEDPRLADADGREAMVSILAVVGQSVLLDTALYREYRAGPIERVKPLALAIMVATSFQVADFTV